MEESLKFDFESLLVKVTTGGYSSLCKRAYTYDQCMRDLLRLAREIGGDGFDDMSHPDVTEITQPTTGLAV